MTEEKENKIRDINNIKFSNNLDEIVSSLEIILMMFEVNDDKDIILACKKRLSEGVKILKEHDFKGAENFKVD